MASSATAEPIAGRRRAGSAGASPAPSSSAAAAVPIRRRRSAPIPDKPAAPPPSPSTRRAPPPSPSRPFRLWTTGNQLLAALLLWAGLAGLVYAVDPDGQSARTAFFALFFGALFFTLTPLIRFVSLQFSHSRLYQEAVSVHAARQAFMLSTLATLYAFLQLQRALTLLTAVILFGVFAIIEIVALARR